MKKVLCLVLAVVFVFAFTTQAFAGAKADSLTAAEKDMMNAIDKNKADIMSISKQIWELKELGNKEFKSAALLEDALEKQGFVVQRGVEGINPLDNSKVNMPTAFIATYEGKKGGPTVGVMVEYDALPNGHACGHNLISQTGYAAAIGIKEALKTTPGKLIVYGTPAEETDGSKQFMLAAGLMKDIDVMFASHGGDVWNTELQAKAMVWPKYDKGLVFTGKASHASAAPEMGRSALDAAMIMGIGFEFLREHMVETDRIHYAVLEGGKAANVVPDIAKVDLMVRANDSAELKLLTKRVDNIIKAAALMTDTTVEYTWDWPLFAATPNPELYHFVAKTASAVGVSEEKFVFGTKPGGSTDAGNVGYELPTTQISFPVAEKPTAGHSTEFAAAANTEYAMNNSMLAGKIMALSAYRLLTDPVELQKVKDDFKKNYK